MSHVVMHNRDDLSYLPMSTCAMSYNYEVVMAVASITLDEYTLGQFYQFLHVTAESKVNKIKGKILSKAVLNIGCKVLRRPEILLLISTCR